MATINLGHVKGDKGDTGATGPAGATGATGAQGPAGPAGPGCPTGGTAGQMLTKASGTDYDYNWSDVNLCTMRKVPFTIAANDWTLSNGVYTATFTTAYVTSSSIETVYYDESIDSYMKAYIVADKKSGGGGVVFSTKKIPTGIITGQIHVMDNDDGKVPVIIEGTVTPVANGGTQESTVAGVQNRFGIVNIDSISDAYSSSATYAVGDMCIYNNTLYKCSTAISTAEEWNSAHWTETTISDELDSLGEQMANINSRFQTLFQVYTYSFNSVTINGNGNAVASATNKSEKPSGYSSLAPYEIATGSVDVIIRGFSVVDGDLYLVNRSSSSVTITPTFKIMIYKG